MAHTIETLTERYADANTKPNPGRIERLQRAIELGASDEALEKICDANRTSMTSTITLPQHHLETLSRGRGWARMGRGKKVTWGDRVDGGYRVGPGFWTVGGNDGFNRKKEDTWTVEHVRVGDEIWTVAS